VWKTIRWIFGIIIVLGLIGSLIDKSSKKAKPINTVTNPATPPKPKPTPAELLIKAKKLIDENNSSAAIENLKMIEDGSTEYPEAQNLMKQEGFREAKKLLKDKPKSAPDDHSETYLWQAASNLEFIKKGDKEYSEAQKLLKQIHARQKILLEKDAADTERRMATARKDYAKELEFNFLDKLRMDTTITVSGKNNTIIKIKWILWSRVTVYEFFKDGKILSTWRSMGFKKYIITDGYRWTWRGNV